MDLQSALKQIQQTSEAESIPPLQALKNLNETVTEALLACIKGQPDRASQQLLAALPQLLIALTALGVDPIQAGYHPLEPEIPTQRLIYIDGNRVEVRVDNEIRGSWSIWSVADLKEVCRLAEEFDCGLVYSFIGSLSPSRSESFPRSILSERGSSSGFFDPLPPSSEQPAAS
ncbi:MAG: hypothetical protein NW237_06355 [Cyanobacteriota bacterium]|nr:hypothetical protein [Cyanobacteriota bacterium]